MATTAPTALRKFNTDVVRATPAALNAFFRLCRDIERESQFPNVDDFPDGDELEHSHLYPSDAAFRKIDNDGRRRSMFLEKLMLVVSETAEMCELARKGGLSGLAMRVEVADLIIRLGALAAACDMDKPLPDYDPEGIGWSDADETEFSKLRAWLSDGSIEDVLLAKSCYNTSRPIKHGKAL